jgi:hypothetical protein
MKYFRLFFICLVSACWVSPAGAAVQRTDADVSLLVMPFKITDNGEKAHLWLGRAVSYYLAAGLERNGFRVLNDDDTAELLDANAILFPYSVTKATVMKLASGKGCNIVVWGEIGPDPEDDGLLHIRSFAIDLNRYTQDRLPVLKGRVNQLYTIMAELLKAVVKDISPGRIETGDFHLPDIRMNLHNYEKHIKKLVMEERSQQ